MWQGPRAARALAAAVAAAALVSAAAPRALAQPSDEQARSAARELGYEGVAHFEQGRYAEALDALDRAYRVVRVPTLGLWSARALQRLGRLVEASERYLEVARLPDQTGVAAVQEEARLAARAEHEALARRIPTLTVVVTGAPAAQVQIAIDGAPLGALAGAKLPLDPGAHRVRVAWSLEAVEREVELAEGEAETLVVPLAPRPPAAASSAAAPLPRRPTAPAAAAPDQPSTWSTQRTAAVVLGGAGVAAVGVGTALGAMAAGSWADAREACPQRTVCPDDRGRSLSLEARAQADGATAALLGGGVAVASAAVLWLTAPSGRPPPRATHVRVSLGPRTARLSVESTF